MNNTLEEQNKEAIRTAEVAREQIGMRFTTEQPYPTHAFTKDYLDSGTLVKDIWERRKKGICVMCGIELKYEIIDGIIKLVKRKEHKGVVKEGDICDECTSRMLSGKPRKKVNNLEEITEQVNKKKAMGFLLMRSGD